MALPNFFLVVMDRINPFERFFVMQQSTVAVPDLVPRNDGVFGSGRYRFGDRIGYATAYFFFEHEDPGHHDFLDAIRMMVQAYHTQGPGFAVINDKYGVELDPQGSPPYPYEPGSVVPVDTRWPGATFDIYHQRPGEIVAGEKGRQLLSRWTLPAQSPSDQKVKWYYQLGGLVVAVHDDLGPVARVIVAGTHPRYLYAEQRFDK